MFMSNGKSRDAASASRELRAGLYERRIADFLARAGVAIDGGRPWDLRVHDRRLFRRVYWEGSLGLGESYMDGWWDAGALDVFFHKILSARLDRTYPKMRLLRAWLRAIIFNLQRVSRAYQVGERHYDLGNEFFAAMLDKRMVYTCAYWKYAQTLDEAQEHKLELTCRKLGLERGMRVLDIGCGWGGFARYAAERYGVSVVGITVSRQQAELARELCRGLPVEIRLQDYREVDEPFDHIVSLGMFEHVGHKNYRTYMEIAARCLKPGGLFLLHTIGKHHDTIVTDPWVERYIFPNGEIPALVRIARAIEDLFLLEDVQNIGPDYDKTLMSWYRNFDAAWPRFEARYGRRFYRMWKYYLHCCAGAFRARALQLWQFVLSPLNREQAYRRPAY